MMKTLRLFFVAVMTMIGMNAMAQEVTLDFYPVDNGWDIPSTAGNAETEFTNGTYKIKLYAPSGGSYKLNNIQDSEKQVIGHYIILGKKDAYLTLPAFSFDVEKIVVTGNSGASANVKQNIFVGSDAVSTETAGAKETNTYLIASGKQAAGTIYTLKVTSTHNTQITKIEIFKASGINVPEISGTEIFQGSTQVTITADDGVNIFYTTDGTDPSSNSLEYTAPITIENSCTVKAVAEKGGVLSAVVSKTFVKTEGDGSETNPFTCEDILNLPKGYEAADQWVKGIIVGSIKNNAVEETPTVNSNVALAATAGETTFANIVPVQLTNSNKEAINVVDNGENIGKELAILGNITAYFGNTGLKNTSTYKLDGATAINTINAEELDVNAPIYNTAGQQVNKNYKGVVIQNGKKILVK
jgi:hypothetical protein